MPEHILIPCVQANIITNILKKKKTQAPIFSGNAKLGQIYTKHPQLQK